VVSGYRSRLYAKDGDDLGVREFSEPNWAPGDVVALADRVDLVSRVVYLDDDSEVRRGRLSLRRSLCLRKGQGSSSSNSRAQQAGQ
jgi:hypothetical protein